MTTYTLPQTPSETRLNIPAFSFDGRYGLPNSVREALLYLKQGEAALLIDALLYCGFTADKLFTARKVIDKLAKNNFTLSKALVRRALNSGVFRCGKLQTHRPGRPEKIYHMPLVGELVEKYAKGHMSASDALELKDMQCLRLYRQALHREFIRRAPGIYSRAFLGDRLGVGKRTTRNYDLREGIRAIRRLLKQNLAWAPDWRETVASGKAGRNWLRICYKNGRFFDAPLVAEIVKNNMWKKHVEAVYFVTQMCNRYVYAPEANWADYLFMYQNDDERVFAHSSDPYGLRKERLSIDPKSVTLSIDRKAYQPKSDPIPAWLPPDMAARRISTNPFLPRHQAKPS